MENTLWDVLIYLSKVLNYFWVKIPSNNFPFVQTPSKPLSYHEKCKLCYEVSQSCRLDPWYWLNWQQIGKICVSLFLHSYNLILTFDSFMITHSTEKHELNFADRHNDFRNKKKTFCRFSMKHIFFVLNCLLLSFFPDVVLQSAPKLASFLAKSEDI